MLRRNWYYHGDWRTARHNPLKRKAELPTKNDRHNLKSAHHGFREEADISVQNQNLVV